MTYRRGKIVKIHPKMKQMPPVKTYHHLNIENHVHRENDFVIIFLLLFFMMIFLNVIFKKHLIFHEMEEMRSV